MNSAQKVSIILFTGVVGLGLYTATTQLSIRKIEKELIYKGQCVTNFIFPYPTGPYGIGTKLIELTDAARHEPETGKPRELVVQIWYPAFLKLRLTGPFAGKPGEETAPYAYEAVEWYKALLTAQGASQEDLRMLGGIRTHAIANTEPYNEQAPYPVVIFAHGNGAPRGGYSFFCEEIASHGYVVVMVMHTYVTPLIRFADGREIRALANQTKVSDVIEKCCIDIQFMLDQATYGAFGPLTSVCDFNNIGIVGHSLGGMTTAQVCRRDKRVKAGINLDGTLWGIDSTKPFYKPFLYMRTANFYADMIGILEQQKDSFSAVGVTKDNFIGSVEKFCQSNGKDTMQIIVEGANHMTFMDIPIVYDCLAKFTSTSEKAGNLNGTYIAAAPDILNVIKDCIITFLNKYLKGQTAVYPSQVLHGANKEDFEFYIPDLHPKHKRIELDPVMLNSYSGQYRLGNVDLTVEKSEDDVLWVRIADQPAYPIYPESETKFFYTVADRQMSFVKDKQGNVIKLIVHQGTFDQIAEKVDKAETQ